MDSRSRDDEGISRDDVGNWEVNMIRLRSRACGLVAVVVAFALGGSSSGAGAQNGGDAGLLARRANLEVEGVSIIDALRRLQARSAVPIGFSRESIPQDLRVSCSCLDKTVQEALDTLLAGTGLIFAERRNQILHAGDARPWDASRRHRWGQTGNSALHRNVPECPARIRAAA